MDVKQFIVVCGITILALVLIVSARNIVDGNINYYSASSDFAGNNQAAASIVNGVQNVKLTYDNYGYKLSPSELKKGIHVKMEVDLSTVTGCMTSVNIPAFSVRKYVKPGDNIIEFTPDKAGTFQITCSMGMGKGTFAVVDDSGSAGSYVEPVQATGGSCGASGGGCGCGGGKF